MKPIEPVMTNAHRHPHVTAMNGTVRGAMIAPMLAPELNMPVANARSFFGNHSATVLIAEGKLPASLKPKAERTTPKPNVLLAIA